MKRIEALLAMILCALSIQAQEFMVVETNSGSKTEIETKDVKRVYFETRKVSNNPFNPQGEEGTPVDLGLSVLWADWNVGATSIYETGGLYGWGDPTGDKISKNVDDYPCPYPVPENISGTEYDIARARWGGSWRMPTFDEMKELARNTNFSKVYIDGTYYTEAKGKNGNRIIFPVSSGYRWTDSEIDALHGSYWTSMLSDKDNVKAWMVQFEDATMSYIKDGLERYYGLCVRPVMDKKVEIKFNQYKINASLTKNSVIISGTKTGKSERYELGILYGTSSNLTGDNGKFLPIGDEDQFDIPINGLNPGTIYYYRPVGRRNGKYCIGEVSNFTTKDAASYAIGEYYPDMKNAEGVVFEVTDDGMHGKIVSLDEISDVKWSYDINWMSNCSDGNDGSKNIMDQSRSQLANWCYNHGTGWYCPARFELAKLSKEVLTKVNATLERDGYTKHEGFYWSSTQYGSSYEDLAYVVTVAETTYAGKTAGTSFYNQKGQARKGVAVKKF